MQSLTIALIFPSLFHPLWFENCRSDIGLSYTQAIPTNFSHRQDKSLHMQGSL